MDLYLLFWFIGFLGGIGLAGLLWAMWWEEEQNATICDEPCCRKEWDF